MFKDKALQNGLYPKMRIWLGIKTIFFVLDGNTGRCHKKHMELGTDKKHFLCTQLGQRGCPPWAVRDNNESARAGISVRSFWSPASSPCETVLTS